MLKLKQDFASSRQICKKQDAETNYAIKNMFPKKKVVIVLISNHAIHLTSYGYLYET